MIFLGASSLAICLAISLFGIRTRREADLVLIVGVLLRFASVLFYSLTGDSDPDGYGLRASMFAAMSLGDLFENFQTGAYFYSWLISFPYRLFGEDMVMIRSFNALLSCAALFMSYDLSKSLFGSRTAYKAGLFLAVFPALIRFAGPFASRESLFVFLLLAAVSSIYAYYSGKGFLHLACALACIIFATIVHTSAFMLFVLLLLVLLNNSSADRGMKMIAGGLGFGLIGVVVAIMFGGGIGTEKLYLDRGGLSLETMNWISEASADGRAAYLQGFTFNNPVLTALFLPVRAAFFLYAPFIWMIRNMLDVFGCVDGCLYILLTVCALRNVRDILRCKNSKTRNQQFVLYLGITLLCMLAMFAIGTSNYGTALRHRAKLAMLFVLIGGSRLDWPFHLKRTVDAR